VVVVVDFSLSRVISFLGGESIGSLFL